MFHLSRTGQHFIDVELYFQRVVLLNIDLLTTLNLGTMLS